MGGLTVVVGGQYGSEAKGHVAGFLAPEHGLSIRVAGPNAGHSVVRPHTGKKYALRQIPVGAVTHPTQTLAIAAGSEIDPWVLLDEIAWLENDGILVSERLVIDPAATVMSLEHAQQEDRRLLTARIGSTGKGIGAARADRIWRSAATIRDVSAAIGLPARVRIEPVDHVAYAMLDDGQDVLIEGTQGYGLGLHTPHYPKTTSSDCRAVDFLAMAGISPWYGSVDGFEVWVVYRPYPIRVAGDSGALHGETTWEQLGLPPEYTTVTKKIRRVGAWDRHLAVQAMIANGGPPVARVALTMADQLDPAIAGETDNWTDAGRYPEVSRFIGRIEGELGAPVELLGTGPGTMIDLRIPEEGDDTP